MVEEVKTKVTTITVNVDDKRHITIEADPALGYSGFAVKWVLEIDGGILKPTGHVKPLETAALLPDPATPWDVVKGMPLNPAAPAEATCHKELGTLPKETKYQITIEFPDEGVPRTMIGSILIVDP